MVFSSFRYFLAVAHDLNITKTSKKLHITQQSLSERIKRLENEYHVKLFQRKPHLRLTYAGEIMVGLAEQVVNLQTQIESAMADATGQIRGTVSVGIRPSHSKILIPTILPVFSKRYPYVNLRFTISPSKEITQLLLNGQLDLGIISPRYGAERHLVSMQIHTDNYCMVVPENILNDIFHVSSEGYQQGQALDFSNLASVPILMTKPGGATREMADDYLLSLGIRQPNILMETTGYDFETNFVMCAKGIGITFAFDLFYNYFIKNYPQKYRLFRFPVRKTNCNPDTMICYHRNRILNIAAKEFIKIAKDIASKL